MSFRLNSNVTTSLLSDYDNLTCSLDPLSSGSGSSISTTKGTLVGNTFLRDLPQVFQLEIFNEINQSLSQESALSESYDSIVLTAAESEIDKATKDVSLRKIGSQDDTKKNLVYYFVCKNSFPDGALPEDNKWGEHNINSVSAEVLAKSVRDAGLYYHEDKINFILSRLDLYKAAACDALEFEASSELPVEAGCCTRLMNCVASAFSNMF